MLTLARAAILAAFTLAPGLGASLASTTGPEAPLELVRSLQEALLESMKAGEQLDYSERVARLRPVIDRTHHFDEITRFMLGRHGRELSDDQFATVVEALRQLSLAEYASRFNRYNGQRLKVLESSPMSGDRVMVTTELVKANGEAVQLEYMLQDQEGRWGVVNVVADGVSDLALKRAEYSTVLRREGYTALVERLRKQTADVRNQNE